MIIAIIAKGLLNRSILFSPYKKKIQNNQKNTAYDGCIVKSIFYIPFYHNFTFLTKYKEANKNDIENIIAILPKVIIVVTLSTLTKNGEITPAVNQAAEMVFKNSLIDKLLGIQVYLKSKICIRIGFGC